METLFNLCLIFVYFNVYLIDISGNLSNIAEYPFSVSVYIIQF